MKKVILTFVSFYLLFGFISLFAQDTGGEVEKSYINPFFNSNNQQSIFEDTQPIYGSFWDWAHPSPSGVTLNWIQRIDANNWFAVGEGGTFLKTTDAGATWFVIKNVGGLSTSGIYRTLFDGHFFDVNIGLVCGSDGMLVRTTNGGQTWDSVGVGVTGPIYDLFFIDNNIGYICGTTAIDVWKTTDGGLTWNPTVGDIPATAYGMWAIDEDTLLFTSAGGNVQRSTDGGASWSTIYIGYSEILRHIEMSSPTNGWISGDNAALAYTTDAGATWTLANTGIPATTDLHDVDIEAGSVLTLSEGFDDISFPPAGWHSKNILGSNEWGRYTAYYHSAPACARIAYQSTGGEDWLVTPQLSIVSGDSLKFWARRNYTTLYEPDTLQILVSTTDTAITSFTNVIYQSSVNLFGTTIWTNVVVDLSSYAGSDIYIAFRHYDTDGNGLGIDDVEVGQPSAEVVYATGDPYNIYYSTDMGTSWAPFNHLDPSQPYTGEFYSTDIGPAGATTVGTRGMINSWNAPAVLDAGTAHNNWIKAGVLYDIWAYRASGKVIAVGNPSDLGNTHDPILYSLDGGDNWAVATMLDTTLYRFRDLSMVDSLLGYTCGQDHLVYKTTDGGLSWFAVTSPAVSAADLEEIFFVDANTGYTYGEEGLGYKTTDGGNTWNALTTGHGTSTIHSSYFLDAMTGYTVGSDGKIYMTTDGGATTIALNPGVGTFTLRGIWFVNANVGYLCGSNSIFRKTTDGGVTWGANALFTNMVLNDIEFNDENNGVIVGGYGRTFITGDGGDNWFFESIHNGSIYGVAIERTSLDTAATFACGTNAYIMKNAHVIVPVELTSFTATVSGNNVTLSWQTATEINNMGFQVERKDEEEWVEAGFVSGNGTTTEIHSYTFTDEKLPSGTYNYRIKQIDYDGTYEYFNLEQVVEVSVPDKFDLSQNYPNPFNPTTKITYSVPVDGFVNISVYNLLGEKVANLVNTNVKAGHYTVSFDATNIASGMYIYRMETGDYISVKKMMILK